MAPPSYDHTQTSPVRYFLRGLIILTLLAGWNWRAEFWAWFSMCAVAGVCLLVLLTMTRLTIQGNDEGLNVRFGPVPLFSTRIPYADIKAVHATRSRVIDGWGIHYIPGRGWTWSLWGFDCVDIDRPSGSLRLGSDDAGNLAAFLQTRLGA
jgi:hypothetical protein